MVSLRARLRHRSARLLRHPWGRWLATVFVALLWFLVIKAVVGPAGGGGNHSGRGGGTKGGGADRGGVEDGGRRQSYYRRIVGEVAVGPSLSDPWKVREIDIAAADWGLGGGDGPLDSGGGGGGSGDNGAGGSSGSSGSSRGGRGGGGAQGGGVEVGGRRKRERGEGEGEEEREDVRVNRVITGALEPVGGARTRTKVDLVLTIFSGPTEVRQMA